MRRQKRHWWRPWCAWGVLAIAVLMTPAFARATLLGVTFGNELVTIDETTGAGTLVGRLDSPMAAFGLADYNGRLFTYDQIAYLVVELDPATGHTLNTYDLGLHLIGEGAIAFRSDGIGFVQHTSQVARAFISIQARHSDRLLRGIFPRHGWDGFRRSRHTLWLEPVGPLPALYVGCGDCFGDPDR
jgi:hypothetical protein